MKQPTKEEVEKFRASISEVDGFNNPAAAAMIMKQRCLNLCDAYLALREEVDKWKDRVEVRDKHIDALKADNEALREACNVVLEYFETGVTVESEAFSDYVRSLHPRWDVRYE